jgi:hypothetical protein
MNRLWSCLKEADKNFIHTPHLRGKEAEWKAFYEEAILSIKDKEDVFNLLDACFCVAVDLHPDLAESILDISNTLKAVADSIKHGSRQTVLKAIKSLREVGQLNCPRDLKNIYQEELADQYNKIVMQGGSAT